jgi:hypothetical protein
MIRVTRVKQALLAGIVVAVAAANSPAAAEACWWTQQHLGLFCNDGGPALVCEWGDACVMSCGEGILDVPCEEEN